MGDHAWLRRLADIELTQAYVDLADARLGARSLSASDEFFAPAERMLQPGEPQWREGVYDDHGKWMDGWETRRRRDAGYDYCIVRLAGPCTLAALDIDTRYFTGNYPPNASVQACCLSADPDEHAPWRELLPYVALQGNQRNLFRLQSAQVWTHLKLTISGRRGRATTRLRCRTARLERGQRRADRSGRGAQWRSRLGLQRRALRLDAQSAAARARRQHGRRLGDAPAQGTRLRLGHPEAWTCRTYRAHRSGHRPLSRQLPAPGLDPWCVAAGQSDAGLISQCLYWPQLLAPQRMQPDQLHVFGNEVAARGSISHVRVNMHPDGGLSRVRLFGRPLPG